LPALPPARPYLPMQSHSDQQHHNSFPTRRSSDLTRGNGYDLFQTGETGEITLREKSFNDNLNKETTFQVDYVHPFRNESTIREVGGKSMLRDIRSHYQLSILDRGSGSYVPDPSRSNIFDYRQD